MSIFRDAENIYHLYNGDVSSKIQFAKEQNNEDGLTVWLEFTIQYSEYQCKMKYFEEALGSLHKSYDICVHLYGENCRQLVHILSSLGRINFMRNDFEQSSKYLQKAYEIGQRYPDVKEMSVVYTYLGNLSLKRGLLTEAKNYCDTALDYATRHMVSDRSFINHYNTYDCLNNRKPLHRFTTIASGCRILPVMN